MAVYICIYLFIYPFIHTYIYTFFINLIVKSIETFVVCAVSRIKLLLLLLLSIFYRNCSALQRLELAPSPPLCWYIFFSFR